jgi:hypothetical protein
LKSDEAGAKAIDEANGEIRLLIPLPALEVDQPLPVQFEWVRNAAARPITPPLPGAATQRFRIVREEHFDHKLVLEIEGPAGGYGEFSLLRHGSFMPKFSVVPPSDVRLGMIDSGLHDPSLPISLDLHFLPGEGWRTTTVTLTW